MVLAVARGLLAAAMPTIESQGLTLIGLSLTDLENEDSMQLALPFERRGPRLVDAAIDGVRNRFGAAAVTRAVLLGRDPGFTVPLLPD